MTYLSAAVIVIGTMMLLNLALTFALLRYLRQSGPQVANSATAGARSTALPVLPAGTRAPVFATPTTSGERRSLLELKGERALIGFFRSGCSVCGTEVPAFVELARTMPGGTKQVLAVIIGQSEAAAGEFAAEHSVLAEVAAVVLEQRKGGAVSTAFSLHASPSFYLIDPNGWIEASGVSVSAVTDTLVPA